LEALAHGYGFSNLTNLGLLLEQRHIRGELSVVDPSDEDRHLRTFIFLWVPKKKKKKKERKRAA